MSQSIHRLLFPAALAVGVMLYGVIWFDGAEAAYRVCYYAPTAFVLGSLVVDRWLTRRWTMMTAAMDLLVLAICIVRPLYNWPAVSGHAALFVYAFLSGTSPTTKVSAALLGVITLYAKLVLWRGDATLWPGLVVGLIAGILQRWKNRD